MISSVTNESQLSFFEQRLWFLDQILPKRAIYNITHAFHLEGNLDLCALRDALTEITRRHAVLRSTYRAVDGRPSRQLQPPMRVPLHVLDLRKQTSEEQKTALLEIVTEEARLEIDLNQGPLLRVRILRLQQNEFVLLFTIHHIVFDGWSLSIFLKELALLYESYTTKQSVPLGELPFQYMDFARMHAERPEHDVALKELAYWKERLTGNLPSLDLPFDRNRPLARSYEGCTYKADFSIDLLKGLRTLSGSNGVSLFITLLAAFQTLLFRYTGQQRIAVGVPVAARDEPKTHELIGFFVNTVVLVTDFDDDPTFTQLLNQVKQIFIEALSHKDLPFQTLVEELNPLRSLSHDPFVQVFFQFFDSPLMVPALPGIKVTEVPVDPRLSKFDLTFDTRATAEGLQVRLQYSTDLFDHSTIVRMVKHYENILNSVLQNSGTPVSWIDILDAREWHELQNNWNRTDADYPKRPIPELFEQAAVQHSNLPAVVFGKELVTYEQLNRRANQIAHHLKNLGIGRSSIVAVCLPKSPDVIVTTLGILKSGAAYLPLDPSYPTQHLAYMMKDAGAAALVTTQKIGKQFHDSLAKIFVDTGASILERESTANLEISIQGDDIAYIMYTSGSTGKPKGVLVPHRAIVRLVSNTNYVEITPADAFAQASNISFDAATFEIWGALLHGARLCLLPQNMIYSPQEFSAWLRSEQITILFLTTSLFHLMVLETPTAFKNLRYLLFGGEKADVKRVAKIFQQGRPANLLHVYGPTEATTFSTCYSVESLNETDENLPIGLPISNTKIYLLDANLQPVPIGVCGEIYIGGAGVAAGYHNRPELTSRMFIPDPFCEKPGSRLYRTGDLGRRLADGEIQFVGRNDHQVKIRGFRIEPGEVESILRSHPLVRDAAVLVSEDSRNEKFLKAYIVFKQNRKLPEITLRTFLKRKVPDYMVPAEFLILKDLPLSPNKKLDRASLQSMKETTRSSPDVQVAADDLELRLLGIWQRLLRARPIRLSDNFFDLGGHSLLAIRLFDLIEKEFKKQIPVAKFFDSPTIKALASVLREGESVQPDSLLLPVQSAGSEPPLFLAGDLGMDLAAHLGPEHPVYVMLDRDLVKRCATIEEMADRYLIEVRKIQPEGPYFLGGFCQWGVLAYQMAVQLQTDGHEVKLILMESYIPRYFWPIRDGRKKIRKGSEKLKHADTLLQLGYVRRIVEGGTRRLKEYIQKANRRLQIKKAKLFQRYYFLFRNGGVPRTMRERLAFMKKFPKLAMAYIPKSFKGDVTLICRENGIINAREAGWDRVIVGATETHILEFDNPIAHTDLLRDPYVASVADVLKRIVKSGKP